MIKQRFMQIFKACVVLLIFFSSFAFSQIAASSSNIKYLALVIGNSKYSDEVLHGPDNDANDMAKVFSDLGFEISNSGNIINLNRISMDSALKTFIDKVDKNTIAVIYYSGHGLEDEELKKNFLVPTDVNLKTYDDMETQLVSLDNLILRLGKREARNKIVILDACRNMPQSLRYKSFGKSAGLGETKIQPGTAVIYAASPGSTARAASESERNSVFTAALLQAIREKQHDTFSDIINRAAELTLEITNDKQHPWFSGHLGMFKMPSRNLIDLPLTDIVPVKPDTNESSNSCKEFVTEQIVANGKTTYKRKCIES